MFVRLFPGGSKVVDGVKDLRKHTKLKKRAVPGRKATKVKTKGVVRQEEVMW